MKKHKIFLIITVSVFGILLSFKILDNDVKKNTIIQNYLTHSLTDAHFLPKQIDDDFSEKVYKLYLQRLDFNKRFFIQDDIDKFVKYKDLIDNEVLAENFDFFNLSEDIYTKRIKEVEDYIHSSLEKPFDFTKDEAIELDPEKRTFSKDKKELKEYWRASLKYQVMVKLADKLQIQEDAASRKDTTVKVKTYDELEKDSRTEVQKTYDDWFHRVTKLNEDDDLSIYFNCMTSAYDPHTEYFPPADQANFDITMSGKLEGIGAQLTQPNAYIKVAKIIPGSPCWRKGEPVEGDIILKVAQGDATPVDVVDMRIDDAIKLIRGKKGTEVRLTLKKADGTIKVVTLIRDIILIDETFAKSAVLKRNGKKIGYIYLPEFYADFDNRNGRRCAVDVEKEIVKLKAENVDGIILDLRNNGGGSLQDVVDMVGLFIKKGPVVQVKPRYGTARVLRDDDSRVLYDGPFTLMINEFSASASEIMAAAIQDYGRGVIVGSPKSFGKGTVQQVINFDNIIKGYDSYKPFGAVKLTTQKFYRINGGSTQLKGVASDIVLPDPYTLLDMGEKDLDYPVNWDEIDPSDFEPTHSVANLKELQSESLKRVSNDTCFTRLNEYAQWMKTNKDKTLQTLNLGKYRAEEKSKNAESKRFQNAGKRASDLKFYVTSADSSVFYSDTTKTARVKSWFKDLKNDIYVDEVFKITEKIQK
jgi:carboxyl-terminal processing protease